MVKNLIKHNTSKQSIFINGRVREFSGDDQGPKIPVFSSSESGGDERRFSRFSSSESVDLSRVDPAHDFGRMLPGEDLQVRKL